MGQRRRFTPEFKRQAVQLLKAGQRPAAEIIRERGIPRNRLYKWQKAVGVHVRRNRGQRTIALTANQR